MNKASERIRAAAWTVSTYDLDWVDHAPEGWKDKVAPLDLALREVEGLEAQVAKMREAAQRTIDAFWYKVKSNSEGQAALDELRAALAAEPVGEKEQDGKE